MTLAYKNSGPWGAGNGAGVGGRLTSLQGDQNIYQLNARLVAVETDGPLSITSITSSGTALTIHYSDLTTDGPFPLPVAKFKPKGEWANSTPYFVNDIVSVRDLGWFLVNVNHTTPASPAPFDPEAVDEGDNLLYTQIGPAPNVPSEPQTVATDTFSPTLADANTYCRCTHVDGCAVTLPEHADVAFRVGTEISFRQLAELGPVFIAQPSGSSVNVNAPKPDHDLITPWQGATVTLKKIASNDWDWIGPGTAMSASA